VAVSLVTLTTFDSIVAVRCRTDANPFERDAALDMFQQTDM
jgi:hypothetical protein